MECAICLEEKLHFKVLPCDHVFCEKCLHDLLIGPASVPESINLKSSKSSIPPSKDETKDSTDSSVECPKCRRVTKLDASGLSKLATKYFGQLRCVQCDESKSVEEFRWCRECSSSICSKCYIEKHVSTSEEGKVIGLHSAAKWDNDYPAVRFCLEQLRLDIENVHEKANKAKEYVRSYLEGLQEFMYVEIEQKTTARENDHRQKMATLCEAFAIDSRSVQPAAKANRSYQSILPALFELSGRESRPANFQRYNYSVNSVPYKDLAKYLLGSEKTPEGNLFFDSSLIAKKFSNESVVIGANVIKHPFDACLLPNSDHENTRLVLISDFEAGIFLFKFPTLQLQGPLPLRQTYSKYGRMAILGETEKSAATGIADPMFATSRPKQTTVMITCQISNGQWVFALINIFVDGSKHDHVQFHKSHHFSFPGHEKLHVHSSKRSLFGLSSSSSHVLWRFKGLEEMAWKEVYTVAAHSNPKPYCQIGPIIDYTDHTKILITNGAWQTVDVVKLGWPDDKLWSVQRVELAKLVPNPQTAPTFSEPALFPCWGVETDRAVLIDKKEPFLWYFEQLGARSYQLARFSIKVPQKIQFLGSNSLLLIVQHKDNHQIRALELYP